MSSDGYFEGDDLDNIAFEELDAIEAAIFSQGVHVPRHDPSPSPKESLYDLTFDIEEDELRKLDGFIEDAYHDKTRPVPGPIQGTSTLHQTTLFGGVLPVPSAEIRPQIQRTKSTSRNLFGREASKTKQWDQTAFAKTGLKKGKAKVKEKEYGEGGEEENVEFEQFPPPFISGGWPPPMKLLPDLLEAKHWIYPLNRPKRDYQYNIVKHCLFDNTIVALPTGLGKTFIAGVVMLNYYRWFPEGKVVFVAPTKPLVAQQIDACHQTCGIPGNDAAELTGQVSRLVRGRAWKEKRVFYMTPQTLINDLTSENCDARDIILLVIDEAHKATGDYAYNQVVRFLMAKNPHFRILALTATPGGSPEAVQKLIDGLHISRIEIRDENSLDLKPYIHHKTIKQHIVNMTEDINKVKDLLAKLMETDMKPLMQRGVLWGSPNPVNLHPFAAQSRLNNLNKDQKWAYGPLARLSSLARAMGYLIEGTMSMCYNYIQEFSREVNLDGTAGPGKAAAASRQKKLHNNPLFRAVVQELETQRNRGFSPHPKMDLLKTLVVQHFAGRLEDDKDSRGDDTEETRVMVFVTLREAVDEIVEALNFERPLIRANKFIGQGTDKQGKRGLAQKEQLEVINKFKSGEFNVLVATCIGEEGLDIGDVDLIVCYDAQKTPIRMLQRLGRTGRKRAGFVHVLLAEGREELNLEKAKGTYKEVQKAIWRGEQLELYDDVARLLPESIKPQCLEMKMDIQEYARDKEQKKIPSIKESYSTTGKRKRNADVSRNIPTGASTGFVTVTDLLVKGVKKQRKEKDLNPLAQDDDTDMRTNSNLVAAPRRTKSSGPSNSRRVATAVRRAKTNVQKAKKKTQSAELTSSQFSSKGIDDLDDIEIENGLVIPSQFESRSSHQVSSLEPSTSYKHSSSMSPMSSSSVIDLADSEKNTPDVNVHATTSCHEDRSMAWLVDEDEEPDIEIVDSSPAASKYQPSTRRSRTRSPKSTASIRTSNTLHDRHESQATDNASDLSWMQGDIRTSLDVDETTELTQANSGLPRNHPFSSPLFRSPLVPRPNSPVRDLKCNFNRNEASSSTLQRPLSLSPSPEVQSSPEASFPVRLAPKRRHHIVQSRVLNTPPSSQRHSDRSPSRQQKNYTTPLLDVAAIHSGDEVSEGTSNSDDDVEDDADRLFLEEVPETQVSPSYDQTLAYRQSLFTQAPAGAKAPAFPNGPIRRGVFGSRISTRHCRMVSSSPFKVDDKSDEYALDSFVVDDDAEISYLSDD